MSKELDHIQTAWDLASATWNRDFRHSPEREKVYGGQISELLKHLKEYISRLSQNHHLHPKHQVTVETSKTFAVVLNEEGRDDPLSACYIDTSVVGRIKLILRGRDIDESIDMLVLYKQSDNFFRWVHADFLCQPDDMAKLILQRLFEAGSASIRKDNKLSAPF